MSVKKKASEVVEVEESLDDILGVPGSVALTAGDADKKRSFLDKDDGDGLEFIDKKPEEDDQEEEEDEEDDDSKSKKKPTGGTEDDDDDSDDDDEDGDVLNEIVKKQNEGSEDDDDEDDDDDEPKSKAGRKGALYETIGMLIDDKELGFELFEGEDDITKYKNKDIADLIKANIATKVAKIADEAPLEVFRKLDPKLQDVVAYNLKGGKDIIQVLKTVTASQEISELSLEKPKDQERIVREYYRSIDWEEEDINTKVASIMDREEIAAEAALLKPKLDKKQASILQRKIEEQDKAAERARVMQAKYAEEIFKTLDNPHINGVPLNVRVQENLYKSMVNTGAYQDRHGNPTNGLGHVIEELQFGETPNHALLLEALWLMTNPKEYKESLSLTVKNAEASDTYRKLKTTEHQKTASSQGQGEGKDKPKKRTLKREDKNRSFLSRN